MALLALPAAIFAATIGNELHGMSQDRTVTPEGFSSVQRRALYFSLLALLLLVMALALLRPRGLVAPKTAVSAVEQLWVEAPMTADDISWRHAPALFAAGVVAGLLSGMLGMGGGVLKLSFLLLLLKLDFFFARAISLVTMFFSSAAALWQYLKVRMVIWRFATPMALLALPAAIFAATIGNELHGGTLTSIFGVFVIFLAFNTLALMFADPEERLMVTAFNDRATPNTGYHCATIGALHGAICGLLGISGGVIATPLQQLLLHIPLRHAIANTLLVSTTVTLVAGGVVLYAGVSSGHFDLGDVLFVDLFMGTGAAIGAPLGTRLGERANVSLLRLLFVLLTLGAGLSILW
jgi:uncharacterized membrane protein YfcA